MNGKTVALLVAAAFVCGILFASILILKNAGVSRGEIERVTEQLDSAIVGNRELERRLDEAGARVFDLERTLESERESIKRLVESDSRSRAAIDRIESILVSGTDIIDELIRFFEGYESGIP